MIDDEETRIEEVNLTDGEKHRLEAYWKQLRFSSKQMNDVRKLIEASNAKLIGDLHQMIASGIADIAADAKAEAKRIYDKIDSHEQANHADRTDDLVRIVKIETTVSNAMWGMPILVGAVFSLVQLLSSWLKAG
jgi:Fe2+ transport system protein B